MSRSQLLSLDCIYTLSECAIGRSVFKIEMKFCDGIGDFDYCWLWQHFQLGGFRFKVTAYNDGADLGLD